MRRHDVFLQKREIAKEKYKKEYEFVLSVCKEYGSELAGDVGDKAKNAEIKHLETLFAMPEMNMDFQTLMT
ncbi:MAG: hypothetical protein AAB362_00440 [Patescibacteria group bacterium]